MQEDLFVLIIEDISCPSASYVKPFLVDSSADTDKILDRVIHFYQEQHPDEDFSWGDITEQFTEEDWNKFGLRMADMRYSSRFVEYDEHPLSSCSRLE